MWQQVHESQIRLSTGAGRPDTSGAEAAAVMADSPASAVSDCSRDLSPPELRLMTCRHMKLCHVLHMLSFTSKHLSSALRHTMSELME